MFKINIPAGPLANNNEAQQIGPRIAAAHGGQFTGQWTTVVGGAMSVVEVDLPVARSGSHEFVTDVIAGPLNSNEDAQRVGPHIAASYGGTFTGQWRTITAGVMSVIQVKFLY
jgi:hypothetical protein